MRVLVFGDSITQGFWDTEGGWVARLRKYYDTRQIEDLRNREEPTIFNLGISGGTSETILARFDNETKARKNREGMVIIVSTGLNDSYREGPDRYKSTPESYRHNLVLLASKAKTYSNKILFVGLVTGDETQTMPVFWRDIYYANERIEEFENIMQKVASENGVSFVPVFQEFKKHLDAGEDLLADGLHPNNEGHELIFQLVRPELDKLLAL
ncbi:MAG TPA: GDSL-type esterase/lipase family protein [Candidatus Saccharimonadales bacterium]|nr:GDSL-type esterase/lipase family protein [Candidatus Saccharimonadales bacterium]HSX27492.1 GDSL-type esterase/lipase family protein [Patescibacteria group bacterium]